jgi:uncharacterized protein (UPF0332 family)
MSPRSQEFMDSANERLSGARDSLTARHFELAVSAAYYAMLYAARAALSERGECAKTHGGTWTLFSKTFVATGEFDADLYKVSGRAQEARQEGDYDAAPLSEELAAELIDDAAAFLAAVEELIAPCADTESAN